MDQPLSMNVFNAQADFVKDGLGLDGSHGRVEAAVHLEPVPQALLLAELHHDVEVRPRPVGLVPHDGLAHVLKKMKRILSQHLLGKEEKQSFFLTTPVWLKNLIRVLTMIGAEQS